MIKKITSNTTVSNFEEQLRYRLGHWFHPKNTTNGEPKSEPKANFFAHDLLNRLGQIFSRPSSKDEKVTSDRDQAANSAHHFLDRIGHFYRKATRELDGEVDENTVGQSSTGKPLEEWQVASSITLSMTKEQQPEGPRWALPANTTNLSGQWRPVVTSQFRQEYDEYLQNCSESPFFRKLVTSVIAMTRDDIHQGGRELTITGRNPAGTWTRTLISSGAEPGKPDFEPIIATFLDPDKEPVNVESWWENEGTVHRSVLRGKKRMEGGEFETLRYLESGADEDDSALICESYFHPAPGHDNFKPGFVKWRYERVG